MKTVAERFWARVRPAGGDDCWPWPGSTNSKGYGQMSAGRRGRSPLYVHRVSWEVHCGPVPDGLCVLHSCDNRRCVNPAHLFLGDQQRNSQDMVAKNRSRHGERHYRAKLSVRAVRSIRARHRAGRATLSELAAKYRVSAGAIWHVVHRKTWKRV